MLNTAGFARINTLQLISFPANGTGENAQENAARWRGVSVDSLGRTVDQPFRDVPPTMQNAPDIDMVIALNIEHQIGVAL